MNKQIKAVEYLKRKIKQNLTYIEIIEKENLKLNAMIEEIGQIDKARLRNK